MSVATPPLASPGPVPLYPMRRFTVDEYHRMIQAGILTEDDPVELLEGWIVLKMPRKRPTCTNCPRPARATGGRA